MNICPKTIECACEHESEHSLEQASSQVQDVPEQPVTKPIQAASHSNAAEDAVQAKGLVLPPPRDYAEYERRVCEIQGYRMRSIYRDPLL